MKKYFAVFFAAILAVAVGLFVFTACDNGPEKPEVTAPVISENTKTVELGADDDLVYGVEWNNGTLSEVRQGQIVLTAANYTSDESSLTVKGDYVSGLAEGEHTFTLVTDGGSAEFKIIVNDSRPVNPVVTPDNAGAFNTLDPDDLVAYTVDWGKGSFVSLTVGSETLENETDFTIDGNKLSIVGKGLIDGWNAGTYTFTLTTTTGIATFDLTVVMSGSRWLDQKVFKTADGTNDVSFSMLIGTNTQIASVKEGETALAATAYEYSAENETFVFKADYLATLSAGFHTFDIALDDSVAYTVSVATGAVMADNFENGGTNNEQITFGVAGNSNITGADAIDGKSVDLDLEAPNLAGTLLVAKNVVLTPNQLYVLHMTVRIDGKTQLIFVLPAQSGNQAWMNADGTLSKETGQYVDSRSISTELADNVFELKIYLPVTAYNADGENLKIYFRNGDLSEGAPALQEHTRLIVDNIYMTANTTETFLPASAPTVSPAAKDIPSIQDVSFETDNHYGVFVSLTENDEVLASGDYTIDGNSLTVKESYFVSRGLSSGQTLTFTYMTKNPDDPSQTFTATFTVTLKATVWGGDFEKEFDGTNDVSFGVTMGTTDGASVSLNGSALASENYEVTASSVAVKADFLNTLEQNTVHQFVLTDINGDEFRFAIYVGCTAEAVLYENFEDGSMPSVDNFGIVMTRSINRNGFDGVSATMSGSGTLIFINRPGFTAWSTPITAGETYELSFRFKFAADGKPAAGSGNDWGVFGGNKSILFAFGNSNFGAGSDDGKYAYIEVTESGELQLVKMHCVADKTTLQKDANGVYSLCLTFVAENKDGAGAEGIQVPCWMSGTFDIDTIMVRKVPGIPTMSGSYIFDKTANADIEIPVSMHGSTLTEVRVGDAALAGSDYTLEGGKLTIKASVFAGYDADIVLSVTIVSNAGTSAAVSVTIADSAPFLTNGDVYNYGPDDPLGNLGLDANGHNILEVKANDAVVPAANYVYDADAKTFTFTESYLKTLEGTVEYTITFEGTSVKIQFSVVSMILQNVLFMDFENDNAAATIGQLGTQLDGLAALTQEIVTDNGSKALKISNVPEGLITIYSTISSVKLDPTYLYMYQIDITVRAGVPVLLRYVETPTTSRDFFWIKADGTLEGSGLNPKYSLVKTDVGNGYVRYEIVAYATPSAANVSGNGNFEIATFASDGNGAFDVTIDNFRIAKTGYPLLLIDFEDDDYKAVLGGGLAMAATTDVVTGENSLGGNNSLHYTAGVATNLLLLRPGNAYIGLNLIGGVKYKLSFKMQISNFPTDMSQLQMPIFGANGDIGYVRPDPAAPGEPYIEIPTGSGYTAGKTVIDADKDIYELSITWTNPDTKVELDFSVWGAVDMVIDDICLEVVR